jgi:hypothetical protein
MQRNVAVLAMQRVIAVLAKIDTNVRNIKSQTILNIIYRQFNFTIHK